MGLRLTEEEEILGSDLIEHDVGDMSRLAQVITGERIKSAQEGRRSAFGTRRSAVHPAPMSGVSRIDVKSPQISVISF